MTRVRNSILPSGDNRPVIAILEDIPSRVEWLENNFPDVYVSWDTNVVDFCASVESLGMTGQLALIIMDHDLGGNPVDLAQPWIDIDNHNFFLDKNGHDGRDACMAIQDFNVPVLIWSANFNHAPTMEKILRTRGFLQVSCKSVDHYKKEILQYLENLISL